MLAARLVATFPRLDRGPEYRRTIGPANLAGEPLALQLQHFIDLVEGRADLRAEIAGILPPHRTAERVAAGEPARPGAAR